MKDVPDAALERLVRAAAGAVGARYGALWLPAPDPGLPPLVCAGLDATAIGHPPQGLGLLGQLVRDGGTVRVAGLAQHPWRAALPPGYPPTSSFLGAAVLVRGVVRGALYVTEKPAGFDAADETVLAAFADAAGAAVELATSGPATDRNRIARTLHDHVVQRLFAAGITLRATMDRIDDEQARDTVRGGIDQIEAGLREIRTSILDLYSSGEDRSLRRRLLDTLAELGVTAAVRISGPVDTLVPAELHDDVDAALRDLATTSGLELIEIQAGDGLVIEVTAGGRVSTTWRLPLPA